MVANKAHSVTPSLPPRPAQHCDTCGALLHRDKSTVAYRVDESGSAFAFRLICRNPACRDRYSSVGAFLSQRTLSVNEFASADTKGVWNARIRRGSVRDANVTILFLWRIHAFVNGTLS